MHMAKTRNVVPKAVKDSVLKEFNHRCAVCGADRPHLHHIDENPANNEPLNLIPLCPNCHLTDQHDASNAVPMAKLQFFRRHKHRHILKPQFNPVFRRMVFLATIGDSEEVSDLQAKGRELVTLVRCFAMGEFYSRAIWRHLKPPPGGGGVVIGNPASEARYKQNKREDAEKYRSRLRSAVPEVERLLVEMLDYQSW